MPALNDRVLRLQPTCDTCKHCLRSRIIDEATWVRSCLVDLSEDDENYIYDHIEEVSDGYVDNYAGYSPRFKKLMMHSNSSFDMYHNVRSVSEHDCCQFYEWGL